MSLSRYSTRPAFYSQPNIIRPRTEQISTREDECLDDEPCFFCKSYGKSKIKTCLLFIIADSYEDAALPDKDLESSPNIFPLPMDSLFQVFRPFGVEHMTPAPPVVTPFNHLQTNDGQPRQDRYETSNSDVRDDSFLKFMDPNTQALANAFLDSLQPSQQGPVTTNHRATSSADSIRSSISIGLTDAATVSPESNFGTLHRPSLSYSPSVVKGPQVEIMPEEDRVTIAEIGWMRQMSPGTRPFDPSQYIINPFWTNNGQGNKYLGTMSPSSNQVSDLPDHLNTCVWLEGAPSDVTYPEMVNSIRNCGKLFSLHINPAKEKHWTSAAKIAFCTRIGAERFMNQAQSFTGVSIRGRRISVRWNRNKYRENANRAESRVLRISGQARYVNYATMIEYFSRLFYFHLIRADDLSPGVMVWEFGSILAQAHSAKQAMEREPALMMNSVRVEYAPDPCE